MKASELLDSQQAVVFYGTIAVPTVAEAPKRTTAVMVAEKSHLGVTEGTMVTLRLGFAECSAKDQFSRKIGRSIATGRALSCGFSRTVRHAWLLGILAKEIYAPGENGKWNLDFGKFLRYSKDQAIKRGLI